MKKAAKKFLAVVLVGVMMFCLTACGLDMEKIKGDWTVSTINGKSTADYADSLDTFEYLFLSNFTLTDSKFTLISLTADGEEVSKSYDIQVKSNGFECMEGDKIFMSVLYDDKADALSFKMLAGSTEMSYILKKGKTDMKAKMDKELEDFYAE